MQFGSLRAFLHVMLIGILRGGEKGKKDRFLINELPIGVFREMFLQMIYLFLFE